MFEINTIRMKRFSWIMGLILCVVCTVQAKDRVIERPPFLAWSSSNIEVDKIVMSDTVTTVLFLFGSASDEGKR